MFHVLTVKAAVGLVTAKAPLAAVAKEGNVGGVGTAAVASDFFSLDLLFGFSRLWYCCLIWAVLQTLQKIPTVEGVDYYFDASP